MTSRPLPGKVSYSRSAARFRRNATLFLLYALALAGSAAYLGFDPLLFFREFHHVEDILDRAFPPNWSLLWRHSSLYTSLGQTFSIAFLGTLFGGLVALSVAFLAASNTTPHPVVRWIVRGSLSLLRAIPTFVTMLVAQVAVGIGAFSAVIAIFIGSVAMFGKLFAEAIETVEPGPGESITAIGGSRLQAIRYAVLPAAMPSIIAHWLYAYDINLRQAIALGVFGGGGIGFEFYLSQKLLRHDNMLALVVVIVVLISATEWLSDRLRRRFLAGDVLK